MLMAGDMEGLTTLVLEHPRAMSALISLTYDRGSVLTWRAVEAVGSIVARITERSPGEGRNIVQRLIWSITEESGGIGWSAVEMLAEIVRNSPDRYSDIVPIILGLYEEEIFRPGVLYAIRRIGERRPELLKGAEAILRTALDDRDPAVRAGALLAIGSLKEGDGGLKERLGELNQDHTRVRFYRDGEMVERSLAELAGDLGV